MILRIEDLQAVCSTILQAVDSNELSEITETLELAVSESKLTLSVTNKEYFITVQQDINTNENFRAAVNANLFLKLISKITSDSIELSLQDRALHIKANGNYKLPLIYVGEELLTLPKISFVGPTVVTKLSNANLASIYMTAKDIDHGNSTIQRLCYIDNKGTLVLNNSGACVNTFNFDVEKNFQILVPAKIIKLFKLFKSPMIDFELAHDELNNSIQTKLHLHNSDIDLVAILPNSSDLINGIPVDVIRNRAKEIYPYTITLDKENFRHAIDRLLLFNSTSGIKSYSTFEIFSDNIIIYDSDKQNMEQLFIANNLTADMTYEMILDLRDIKAVLDSTNLQYVSVGFGNHEAICIYQNTITTIIPECEENNVA